MRRGTPEVKVPEWQDIFVAADIFVNPVQSIILGKLLFYLNLLVYLFKFDIYTCQIQSVLYFVFIQREVQLFYKCIAHFTQHAIFTRNTTFD